MWMYRLISLFDVAFFVALPVEFYQLMGVVIHSDFTASAVRARL